jgi:short-subunit dehydrogenase
MKPHLKPIENQVIVITGASSGIGLTTAREAARHKAKVVLFSRSEHALRHIVEELTGQGGQAIQIVGDVGNFDDVKRCARSAVDAFGRIDTWVNNAAASIYGPIHAVALADHRRLFETNYWGVVHGCMVALEHLRERGGAIVNVGSTLSDRAVPIQGHYSASKHAVKGFTDALRMEVEHEGWPVSVTLIKPGSVNTPYTRHAKSYLDEEPAVPPPVYAPEVVAEAILHAAAHPVRDVFVGGGGKAISASGHYAPRLTDRLMEATMFDMQKKQGQPSRHREDNALHYPSEDPRQRGDHDGYTAESSAYTKATLHPLLTGAIAVAGAGLLAALLGGSSRRDRVR